MFFPVSPTAGPLERLWHVVFSGLCLAIFAFLILPLVIVVPLSFNAEAYFTFTREMLSLSPEAFSLRWYRELFTNPQWAAAFRNSLFVALGATAIATVLGTLAALGLAKLKPALRASVMILLLSPMIIPIVIVAAALYFFFTSIGLAQTLTGLILAHAMLGAPFVVTTVLATLSGFDWNLVRAAASLGAGPVHTFRKVTLPAIAPGVISGGLFAFITSLDEVVVVMFLASVDQRTVPRQMWSGIREQLSPTILAAATLLIVASFLLLLFAEMIRRRNETARALTNKD